MANCIFLMEKSARKGDGKSKKNRLNKEKSCAKKSYLTQLL